MEHLELSTATIDRLCKRVDRVTSKLACGNVLVLPHSKAEGEPTDAYTLIGYSFPGLDRAKSAKAVKFVSGLFEGGRSKRLAWSARNGVYIPVELTGENKVLWVATVTIKPCAGLVVSGSYTVGCAPTAKTTYEDFGVYDVDSARDFNELFDFAVNNMLKRCSIRSLNANGSYTVSVSEPDALFQLLMNPNNGLSRIAELLHTNLKIDIKKTLTYLNIEEAQHA